MLMYNERNGTSFHHLRKTTKNGFCHISMPHLPDPDKWITSYSLYISFTGHCVIFCRLLVRYWRKEILVIPYFQARPGATGDCDHTSYQNKPYNVSEPDRHEASSKCFGASVLSHRCLPEYCNLVVVLVANGKRGKAGMLASFTENLQVVGGDHHFLFPCYILRHLLQLLPKAPRTTTSSKFPFQILPVPVSMEERL